jgi:CubicO group peptidase (beta-lactamase class C family)
MVFCTICLTLFLNSCTATPTPTQIASPTPQYDDQGVDQARLLLMNEVIDDLDLPIDSIVVHRNGELIFESYPNPTYGPDDLHLLYSVTKSITSALIGIAMEEGYIEGVDQKVIDFFPDWEIENLDGWKESLTIENLLTMSCGFEWQGPDDGLHTWGDALRSGNPIQYVLNLPMVSKPGSEWVYNGGCSHLLSAILSRATNRSTLDYAREVLFEPLGISKVRWPRDTQGIYFGGQDIWLTPRDMAKFGQLFLDNGMWEGQQIIPSEWVRDSVSTHIKHWGGGYGYQWWTYPENGIFYASGAFEQRIMVIPNYNMVVVFTSNAQGADLAEGVWGDNPPSVDWLLGRFILPACESYRAQTYVNYGFSLELPIGMQVRELGKDWIGNASERSGLIQFHYGNSPFENFGVQWESVDTTPDLDLALDNFSMAIQTLGVAINQQGERSSMSVGKHDALHQAFVVEEGDYRYPGLIAVWYCEESMRTYILYYATTSLLSQQDDFQLIFQNLLDSFACHE